MAVETATHIDEAILEGIDPNEYLRSGWTEITDPHIKHTLIDGKYIDWPIGFAVGPTDEDKEKAMRNIYIGVVYESDPHNNQWVRISRIRAGQQSSVADLDQRQRFDQQDITSTIEYRNDGRVESITQHQSPERIHSQGQQEYKVVREYSEDGSSYRGSKFQNSMSSDSRKSTAYAFGQTDAVLHCVRTIDDHQKSRQTINLLKILLARSINARVVVNAQDTQVHIANIADGTRSAITYTVPQLPADGFLISVTGPILRTLGMGNEFSTSAQIQFDSVTSHFFLVDNPDGLDDDSDPYKLNEANIARLLCALKECEITYSLDNPFDN